MIENQEVLDKIKESKGFYLEELKKSGVLLTKEFLLENKTPIIIKFLVENYELSQNERESISGVLNSSAKEKLLSDKVYSEDELRDILRNNKEFPRGVKNLTLDFVIRFNSEVSEYLLTIDDYGFEKVLSNLFANSSPSELMSVPKVFWMNFPDLLAQNSGAFNDERFSSWFFDLITTGVEKPDLKLFKHFRFKQEHKKVFGDLILELNKNSYSKKTYDELSKYDGFTNLFSKMEFFANFNNLDLGLFSIGEVEEHKDIIKKTYLSKLKSNTYSFIGDLMSGKTGELSKFKLIVDEDFIVKSNMAEGYLNRREDEDSRVKDAYVKYMILQLVFKGEIEMDVSSVFRMITDIDGYGRDTAKSLEDLVGINWRETYEGFLRSYEKLGFSNINSSPEKFVSLFDNSNPLLVLNKPKSSNDRLFDNFLLDHAEFLDVDLANPNALAVLLREWLHNKTNRFTRDVADLQGAFTLLKLSAQRIREISDVDKRSVYQHTALALIDGFEKYVTGLVVETRSGYGLSVDKADFPSLLDELSQVRKEVGLNLVKKLFNQDWISKAEFNDQANLFLYEKQDISKYLSDYKLTNNLQKYRPDFFKYLLGQEVELPPSIFSLVLSNIEEFGLIEDMKRYVDKNKSSIIGSDELFKLLLAHPLRKEIFNVDLSKENKELFDNFMELTQFSKEFSKYQIGIDYNNTPKWYKAVRDSKEDLFKQMGIEINKSNFMVLVKLLEGDSLLDKEKYVLSEFLNDWIKKEIKDVSGKMPFDFIREKFESALMDENMVEFRMMMRYNLASVLREEKSKFVNSLSTEKVISLSNQNAFLDYVLSSIGYSSTELCFSLDGSSSVILVDKLLNRIVETEKYKADKKDNSEFDDLAVYYIKEDALNRVLSVFDNNSLGFVKGYVLENFPSKFLSSYSFRYEGEESRFGRDSKTFIKERFSLNDVVNIFEETKKKTGSYFSWGDVNSDFKSFLMSCFESNDKRAMKTGVENAMTFFSKKNDFLYTILLSSGVASSFEEWGRTQFTKQEVYKTRDEIEHEWFHKFYDPQKIESTFKMIKDDFLNSQGSLKDKENLVKRVIDPIVWNTYYSKMSDHTNKDEYFSRFTDEQTEQFVDMLFEHFPLKLIGGYKIGNYFDLPEKLENFKYKDLSVDKVKGLLYQNYKMARLASVNYDGNSLEADTARSLFKGIIKQSVSEGKLDILEFIDFEVKTRAFFVEEVDYENRGGYYDDVFTGLLDFLVEDKEINAFLKATILTTKLEISITKDDLKKNVRTKKKI